ncbi:MAG: AraC-like DNA-binding protein [Paraglaciecola sp.]|jgi:AraC-like DNA-binding protein
MPILPQVAMPFVRLLYQFWLEHDIPKKILDDILGIDITTEGREKFGISSHKMAKLHQAAVEYAKDPALGVRLGQYIAKSDVTIGYMLKKSETLSIGLKALVAHSQFISESGCFELTDIDDETVRLSFLPSEGIIFSSYQKDMIFAGVQDYLLSVFSDAGKYIKYHYDRNSVSGIEHEKLLECSLHKSNDTYLEISRSLLARINPYADKLLFDKNLVAANKIIVKRLQRLDLYIEVRTAIKGCLLKQSATQENVAQQLNLNIRNLQRRLKEVGVTYQAILDDSREALALHLIKDLALPLYEISFLVGFTEPSAFYKAFRRWTGKRPGDYRQHVIRKSDQPVIEKTALV